MEDNIHETHGLRVGIRGGGCSGMSYMMAFDDKERETDQVFESSGVTVFVDDNSINVKNMNQNSHGGCGNGSCCS